MSVSRNQSSVFKKMFVFFFPGESKLQQFGNHQYDKYHKMTKRSSSFIQPQEKSKELARGGDQADFKK